MARNFNGTDGYLYAATAVATGAPLTMACWFRKTGTASSPRELITLTDPSSFNYILLSTGDGTSAVVYAAAYDETNGAFAPTTATFMSNQWHHAAAVLASNNQQRSFLDGGNAGTDSTMVVPTGLSHVAVAKALTVSATDTFPGDIAEAAIWNTALTDVEIAVLARGFSPLCLTHRLANLVLYQDLIRPLDRPGIGPVLTASGGTAAAEHPRMIYPWTFAYGALRRQVQLLDFYRVSAAAASGGAVSQGWAAVAGADQGATLPIGEVAN